MCGVFAAALFYADDMAIISPSVKGLQQLLDLCLNAKKSKNMYFGKKKLRETSAIRSTECH